MSYKKTVLARLHIGHSYLTRSFQLNGEKRRLCIFCKCNVSLTLKRVLLQEVRKKFFETNSVRPLLNMRGRYLFLHEGDEWFSQVANRLCISSR